MTSQSENSRKAQHEIDPLFIERWSPRSFINDPVSKDDLLRLFEAARWSPSCFNEQPWLFFYAQSDEDKARFLRTLVDFNQAWAKRAPVLLFIASRRHFSEKPGKPNESAAFDAGAAWLAFTLQARKLGLYTHAMAGFSKEKAYDTLGLPESKYELHAAIALGRKGDREQLPEELQQKEAPNSRKEVATFAMEGGFREA